MENKEFFIWCDESIKKGKFYSNFYGGVLVKSSDKEYVLKRLKSIIEEANVFEEIKWQKVNAFQLERYFYLIDEFFELVKKDLIKVRIMFTQNANNATQLENHHLVNEYFLLYYQFIKHAFGLQYSNNSQENVHVRTYFDYLPDTLSKRQQFKEYIKGLESTIDFKRANIKFRKNDITEVDSKDHLPIQFLDIILGAMSFRLNDMHKEKPIGKKRRGKRTIAKEKLYKKINSKIREIRKGFNIGMSTGTNDKSDRWNHVYRHWLFVPSSIEIDKSLYK
jgi:hypothetical protein